MFSNDFLVSRFANEVGPFVGILLHIVEFLGSICVVNVAPVFRAHAMIVVVVGGDGGAGALCRRIFELGH